MINAGRVAIVPKGEYNATTQYTKLDFIQYNGSCYVGLADNIPIGTLPTDTNYFQLCLDLSKYVKTVNSVVKNSISMARKTQSEIGQCSVAMGMNVTASGNASHSEGYETTASGYSSHAEGSYSISSSDYSHAEGINTTAKNYATHAEGGWTVAGASYSHAQNKGTVASSVAQTTIGKYNIEDTLEKYAFIVGNGTSDTERSNALAIDWSGNIVKFIQGKNTDPFRRSYKIESGSTTPFYYNVEEGSDSECYDLKVLYKGKPQGFSDNVVDIVTSNGNLFGLDTYAEKSLENSKNLIKICTVINDTSKIPNNGVEVIFEIITLH